MTDNNNQKLTQSAKKDDELNARHEGLTNEISEFKAQMAEKHGNCQHERNESFDKISSDILTETLYGQNNEIAGLRVWGETKISTGRNRYNCKIKNVPAITAPAAQVLDMTGCETFAYLSAFLDTNSEKNIYVDGVLLYLVRSEECKSLPIFTHLRVTDAEGRKKVWKTQPTMFLDSDPLIAILKAMGKDIVDSPHDLLNTREVYIKPEDFYSFIKNDVKSVEAGIVTNEGIFLIEDSKFIELDVVCFNKLLKNSFKSWEEAINKANVQGEKPKLLLMDPNSEAMHVMKDVILAETLSLTDLEQFIDTDKCTIVQNNTVCSAKFFHKDDVLAVLEINGKMLPMKAPDTGYYSWICDSLVPCKVDTFLCYYLQTDNDVRYYGLNYNYQLAKDYYNESTYIKWNTIYSLSYSYYKIAFLIKDGQPQMELFYSAKVLQLHKGDKLIFLFSNPYIKDEVAQIEFFETETSRCEFVVEQKPSKNKENGCSVILNLTSDDITTMLNCDFISFKVLFVNGGKAEEIKISDYYRSISECTKNSYKFKCYVKKFTEALEELDIDWKNLDTVELSEEESVQQHANDPCHVYLMVDTTNGFHKIGISNNPKYREHTLQSEKPTIELLQSKQFPNRALAEAIESALHKTYAEKRIRGEWFDLSEQDVADIRLVLM